MTAIDKLLEGFKQFSADYFSKGNKLHHKLAERQTPEVLVIACCDSRVDPAIILNAEPGDLFIIRNVANIIPPFCEDDSHHGVLSAIEFAVEGLKIPNILILGHAQCGGIQALMDDSVCDHTFISGWVSLLNDAKCVAEKEGRSKNEKQTICELEGVKLSRKNLLDYPWVAKKMKSGELAVHAWHYDFQSGQLLEFNPEQDKFSSLLAQEK